MVQAYVYHRPSNGPFFKYFQIKLMMLIPKAYQIHFCYIFYANVIKISSLNLIKVGNLQGLKECETLQEFIANDIISFSHFLLAINQLSLYFLFIIFSQF